MANKNDLWGTLTDKQKREFLANDLMAESTHRESDTIPTLTDNERKILLGDPLRERAEEKLPDVAYETAGNLYYDQTEDKILMYDDDQWKPVEPPTNPSSGKYYYEMEFISNFELITTPEEDYDRAMRVIE